MADWTKQLVRDMAKTRRDSPWFDEATAFMAKTLWPELQSALQSAIDEFNTLLPSGVAPINYGVEPKGIWCARLNRRSIRVWRESTPEICWQRETRMGQEAPEIKRAAVFGTHRAGFDVTNVTNGATDVNLFAKHILERFIRDAYHSDNL